ncbi:hypothetical protein ACGFZQ_25935 [Streptomyces sp. NPDC048254]|uniref:hypothetical protein n=1 Tax=Streptomyces sp. NPDC048254 TaxID=3365525 RepID=UPI0037241506
MDLDPYNCAPGGCRWILLAPDAESARGLVLVQALADEWGVAPRLSPRKTVQAEIGVSP